MSPALATRETAGVGMGAGETDLARLLAGLAPALAPYPRVIRTQAHDAPMPAGALLWFREDEAATVIVEIEDDGSHPDDAHWAQVVLRIHSCLEAVGMMAAISTALAERGIPCNVVSAYFHDHLFVPWARREDALAALAALSARHARGTCGDGDMA